MRIVFQGNATPNQIAKAVSEILTKVFEETGVKGKRQVIHNAVIEFNMNVQGFDEPQLLISEDSGTMLTVHTGIKNGELVEYVPVDRKELLEKFNNMVDNGTKELEESSDIIDAEFTEIH